METTKATRPGSISFMNDRHLNMRAEWLSPARGSFSTVSHRTKEQAVR